MSDHRRQPPLDDQAAPGEAEQAPLTPAERAALQAWPTPEVSPALAGRILEAASRARAQALATSPAPVTPATPASSDRRGRAWRWVAVASGAAAALLAWQLALPASAPSAGALTATERVTRALGPSALAVLEPATTLAWASRGRRLEVEQPSGNAFYRVDKGTAFAVRTPAGLVRVTGTCFRVEVLEMKHKQGLLGGAIGAALATVAMVTVYEGGVVVAGSRGETRLAAGQQALVREGVELTEAEAAALAVPQTAELSREQLLAREAELRRRADTLAQRVAELEAAIAADPRGGGPGGPGEEQPTLEPSQEQLVSWAKICKVTFDQPPMNRPEPLTLSPKQIAAAKLSSEEVASGNAILGRQHAQWQAQVRAYYHEIVGSSPETEDLSLQAMTSEIQDKGGSDGEEGELRRRIAQERAGLLRAPADLSKASAFERFYRGHVGLGDRIEAALAEALGAERAHSIRAAHGGWGMHNALAGCPGGSDGNPAAP